MTLENSYASGTSAAPLLGQTIDGNLKATVARHGEREAVVDVATGRRLTYDQLDAAVEQVARGLLARGVEKGDRVGIWAPNCLEWFLVQFATARIGAILVNINPAYRTHELEYVLRQSGLRVLVSATSFKTSDYRAMVEEVRPGLAALRDVVFIGDASWDELVAGGAGGRGRAGGRARRRPVLRRRDQHPVHLGHHRLPEGRDAQPPQHPQQRLLRRRGHELHARGPHLRPGALLPLLRHGDGQPGLDLARGLHRHPRARLRPGRDPAGGAGRALHLALRRADDVHRRAGAARLRDLRPVLAADRLHGRLAVPGRGDEAGHHRDAHGGGHDRLRHDRDLAGVDADPQGRHASSGAPARWAGCTRTSR